MLVLDVMVPLVVLVMLVMLVMVDINPAAAARADAVPALTEHRPHAEMLLHHPPPLLRVEPLHVVLHVRQQKHLLQGWAPLGLPFQQLPN